VPLSDMRFGGVKKKWKWRKKNDYYFNWWKNL